MTLLTYNSKYVIQSTTQVADSTGSYVDDTQATKAFSLTASQTVFVMYNPTSIADPDATARVLCARIYVDGSTYSEARNRHGGNIGNFTRDTVFWIGTLGSGSHTIKGQFSCEPATANTITIGDRILLIYIFDGDEFQFVDNNTNATTSSFTMVDDPNASVTFTPSGACKALYLYVNSNNGATEVARGKNIAIGININAGGNVDYSIAGKGTSSADRPQCAVTCYAGTLTALSTTVKGRWVLADTGTAATVTIDHRQLGVLLFADSTLMDVVYNTANQASSSPLFYTIMTDDPYVTINRTTTETRELLVVANGTKIYPTSTTEWGECYGIATNGTTRQISRQSVGTSLTHGTCNLTCWAENLAAAAQVVKGQYSNNRDNDPCAIDSRTVVAFWFLPAGVQNAVAWLTA